MKHIHDCGACISLGEYNGDFDLYYCRMADGGTMIARYGDEPSAYLSTPIELLVGAYHPHHALVEGLKRQIKRWSGGSES